MITTSQQGDLMSPKDAPNTLARTKTLRTLSGKVVQHILKKVHYVLPFTCVVKVFDSYSASNIMISIQNLEIL